MKQLTRVIVSLSLLTTIACGSGSDESKQESQYDGAFDTKDYQSFIRPQVPSRKQQIERLRTESEQFEAKNLDTPELGQKNFAGAFLGFLGAMLGFDLIGDALNIDLFPPGPINIIDPNDISIDLTADDYSSEIIGQWSGMLQVTKGECGPEALGEARHFVLLVRLDQGTLVVLDQDGFVYSGVFDGLFPWQGWWSNDAGSISTITLQEPQSHQMYVTVQDGINFHGESCQQQYIGWVER